jgi:CRISPR-associated endoribonuclease Cas6
MLTGTIHKWLGNQNKEHGEVSLYSFSWLNGGKAEKKNLVFKDGASMFISAYDSNLLSVLINNIKDIPEMFCGLKVTELIIQENPNFNDSENFAIASPVFIKRKEGDKIKHVLYSEAVAGKYLTETLKTKMAKAGLTDDSLDIQFDTTYKRATTKLINYNGVKNKANWCHVIIKGKSESKAFAWNVGLGNSTGIGFGALK